MRPEVPASVVKPYPIHLHDEVIAGFSRGSSELGIPTANIHVTDSLRALEPGIYFGFSKLRCQAEHQPEIKTTVKGQKVGFNYGQHLKKKDLEVLPMVMSIGYNPFYNNKEKAAEVHIIHEFLDTFYGAQIELVILGYLRPELDYISKGML